jgi:sugar lactone lactonase YvrE
VIVEGEGWTEGPVWSEKHQTLYFSDCITGKIWGYKNGKKSLLLTNAGDEDM